MFATITASELDEIRGMKRNVSQVADCPMNTKKRASLTECSYDALFLQGEKSDINIYALGREWHLHKNILCRSGYFPAIFSGVLEEADKSYIELAVPKDITPEALRTAFGYLYKDEADVSSENVVDVLKAASFLQIDALVDTCVHIMKKSMSVYTVSTYYSIAADLGNHEVTEACLAFLECAFVTENDQNIWIFFQNASIELMENVLSRGLLMALNESDLFIKVIKFATIMQPMPPTDNIVPKILEYTGSLDTKFVSSEVGKPYRDIFKTLKLKQLVKLPSTPNGVKKLAEAVFPQADLHRAGYQQYIHMTDMNRGAACGPDLKNISDKTFAEDSVRCTVRLMRFPRSDRSVTMDLSHSVYLGYNFGMELDLNTHRRSKDSLSFYISPRKVFRNRNVLCRLKVVVMRENTAPIRCYSGIIGMDLGDNMAWEFLTVPLHVSPENMSEFELEQCRVYVGVQAQFVKSMQS